MGLTDEQLDAHHADLEAHRAFSGLLTRRRDPTGHWRTVSISGEPKFDSAGGFSGYWGVARDVTEEVLAQRAVAASETRYRELFTRSPSPLFLHRRGMVFDANEAARSMPSVSERRLHITADTPAKILFTSGSTGLPKGVLNTHGNLASAAEMNRSLGEPLDESASRVSLDWLPWHHAWGGNSNLNGTIRSAGSLYIDGGRPLPGRFQETLENLRELSPSGFATVPAAYPLLLEALEKDEDLRARNSSRTCAAWATAARCCRRRASTACRAWPRLSSASACPSAAAGA